MPPKRILFFLLTLILVMGWTIMTPFVEQAALTSKSINTSPSSSPFGYKGLYLLMNRLQDKPVEFWSHSMMQLSLEQPKTIWFIEPGPGLFFDGNRYANHMRELVSNGYNFVFLLNNQALTLVEGELHASALDYLNDWYDLSLQTVNESLKQPASLRVRSGFSVRTIRTLEYQTPPAKQSALMPKIGAEKMGRKTSELFSVPDLMTFDPHSVKDGAPLLILENNNSPMALQYSRGKGSVTLFLDSFFLKNGQLDKADNAALAVAIQEQFPDQPVLFEVYSSGFNENRDIITYLATGEGIAFLITAVLLLIALCTWVIGRPVLKSFSLKTSDERYFTQETFIQALSQHHLSTRRWQELYEKLLDSLRIELEYYWPGCSREEHREILAHSSFIQITQEEFDRLFDFETISSEEAFVKRGQQVLHIQRKIGSFSQRKQL